MNLGIPVVGFIIMPLRPNTIKNLLTYHLNICLVECIMQQQVHSFEQVHKADAIDDQNSFAQKLSWEQAVLLNQSFAI